MPIARFMEGRGLRVQVRWTRIVKPFSAAWDGRPSTQQGNAPHGGTRSPSPKTVHPNHETDFGRRGRAALDATGQRTPWASKVSWRDESPSPNAMHQTAESLSASEDVSPPIAPRMTTVLQALNEAMHSAMEQDERVYFLGEDILDPYGGAFKVAKGLSTRFPDRVLTTPISEAAIVGIATGMALRGLRPVVEIMFGDFLTLASDQIVNHAAKYRWMYNDQVRVPLVIRTPMGGRRGYGPTHSQCLEKHWLGVPGLRVVAPNSLVNPKQLLVKAILDDDDPVLFIEHKLLYACKLLNSDALDDFYVQTAGAFYPTATISFKGVPPSVVTFACYGQMFEFVREAMLQLMMEHEVASDAVLYTQLSPADHAPLLKSLARTGRLVTVEEGGRTAGWGGEIVSSAVEALGSQKLRAARRVGALDLPLPSSRVLEDQILPSVNDIVQAGLAISKK